MGVRARFSGEVLDVRPAPATEAAARRSLAQLGTVRLRVEFARDRTGLAEPLVEFGSWGHFDLLAVRYVRPGVIQFLHDQSSGGASRSGEIAVDAMVPHDLEVDTPQASDDLDWRPAGPLQRGRALKSVRVTLDGAVAFESRNAPIFQTDLETVVGANLAQSSASLALFHGALSANPGRAELGVMGPGVLSFDPPAAGLWRSPRGVLARFTSAGGDTASLVWRRPAAAGPVEVGWNEAGLTTWSAPLDGSAPAGPLTINLPPASHHIEHVQVGLGAGHRLTAVSDLFGDAPVRADGILPEDWSGPARHAQAAGLESGAAFPVAPPGLPGILRINFRLPGHPLVTGSPLLSAGKSGAADSIFLRQEPDGRFRLCLDHWLSPVFESEPFELSDEDVHSVVIEMGSLAAADGVLPGRLRLQIDGRTVFDRTLKLYPASAQEVTVGANPLGMSTSAARFDGDILAVRRHVPAH